MARHKCCPPEAPGRRVPSTYHLRRDLPGRAPYSYVQYSAAQRSAVQCSPGARTKWLEVASTCVRAVNAGASAPSPSVTPWPWAPIATIASRPNCQQLPSRHPSPGSGHLRLFTWPPPSPSSSLPASSSSSSGPDLLLSPDTTRPPAAFFASCLSSDRSSAAPVGLGLRALRHKYPREHRLARPPVPKANLTDISSIHPSTSSASTSTTTSCPAPIPQGGQALHLAPAQLRSRERFFCRGARPALLRAHQCCRTGSVNTSVHGWWLWAVLRVSRRRYGAPSHAICGYRYAFPLASPLNPQTTASGLLALQTQKPLSLPP